MPADIHAILKQYWGYDAFRPLQEEIIRSVLAGSDTLALLPTGGGKSLCFQVPALAQEGICLVVSPLIALMNDQVEGLKKRGIPAVALHSGLNRRQLDIALDNCVFGTVKFLYVSPERLQTEVFLERLKRMKVALLAVDEAHCISQWGYDFRPPYLQIASLRPLLPGVAVIALTATATRPVREDIQQKLEFRSGRTFAGSFARPNLSYSVRPSDDKEKHLLQMLNRVPGSAVVYVRSRKRTELVARALREERIPATWYHAGLPHEERQRRQSEWLAGRLRVMVATNAFGMGIDKADVRLVVHLDLPETLEAYYQEAGRAGRDGKKAYAVALYDLADTENLRRNVAASHPPLKTLQQVYQGLANYYQLAVGSGGGVSYDFDLQTFAHTYGLPAGGAFQAVERLQEEGLLELGDAAHHPPVLLFTADNRTVYEFQLQHPTYEPLLKVLLRMYGGELFSGFLPISEKNIGSKLGRSAESVAQLLTTLQERGIVAYQPRKDLPQLTFLTPRHDANRLPLNAAALEIRRQRDVGKAEAVISYVQHRQRCRTALLLEYFDERWDQECGICDVCVNRKKEPGSLHYATQRQQVLNVLAAKPLTLPVLVEVIKPADEAALLQVIREMAGAGDLHYLPDGRVSRK